MIKKFLVSIVLLFSLAMSAQSGTASPYSFYGIGDITFKGAAENRFMGGVSVFSDSIHLNLQNPASVAGLRLTTFTLGATNSRTKLISNTQESKASRTSLDYVALAIPIGKMAFSAGLLPYSSVGYRTQTLAEIGSNDSSRRFEGKGGLNKAFAGAAYRLNSKWNVGLNAEYNFGEISTISYEFLPEVQLGSREDNISEIRGVTLNTGVMFQSKVNKKFDFFGSATFTPQTRLTLTNARTISTVTSAISAGTDKIDVDVPNTIVNLPSKFSFGAGFGVVRKWLLGTEITFRQSGNLGSRFNDITNVSYENSQKYSLGGYFIPNFNAYSGYLKRVTYRAGLRYENTGMVIAGKSIEDMAATFGLGLPVGNGSFSNVNLGVELGRRGTKAAGLIRENYANFTLSLSLNDKWFVKRRYD
ncbi:MAG: hypothetical protein CFE23_00185 [Flavobacterium sp. BFFFF1]|uniref:hypothetical protein n=1 Tax=Flavobacterium sp. BFFFF1 TaxID=2015557 RepID=UPI000BCC63CA|nr:hypothetical protein [Flavobacterium sp. BFFFF1]OYU82177.1 MAG: hypothetical protein CFE23_00185 [Flavobacterium sp. BFFFF1]